MEDAASAGRAVLLAGATGLVGEACLRRLLTDPGVRRVQVPSRRPLPPEACGRAGAIKLAERVVDFDRLAEHPSLFAVDQVICALGTTIRKAGSRDAFRRVDHDYPLALARLARDAGASHYLLVSALGADSDSRLFYNRVKGETEAELRGIGFPRLTIVRPSLLLGPRKEFRLGEEVAKRFRFLFPGRYRAVDRDDVAAVLIDAAARGRPGTEIVEADEIRRRAKRLAAAAGNGKAGENVSPS